jgi:spore cortex biosynthesis protein YabQ
MPEQAWLFLATVAAGAAVGVFYDFFRVLRRTAPHGRLAVQLEDLFFWIVVTVLVFYYMLHRNYGEIRVFTLLGTAVGAALYFATVSRYVVKASVAVVEYLKKVITAVVGIVLFPLKLLVVWLTPPVTKMSRWLRKRLRSLGRYGKMKAKKTARNWAIVRKKV